MPSRSERYALFSFFAGTAVALTAYLAQLSDQPAFRFTFMEASSADWIMKHGGGSNPHYVDCYG